MTEEQLFPEAPASASVRCQIEGFEWLITIRGFEMDGTAGRQLLGKIKAVNEKIKQMGGEPIYGKNSAAPAPSGEPEEKLCPIHNVMMKRRTGATGSWYSHAIGKGPDGKTQYCNGTAQ